MVIKKPNLGFDLTKALSFGFIFIGFTVITVTVFLVPWVRQFKQQVGMTNVEYISYEKAQNRYKEEKANLETLTKQNEVAIANFKKDFSESGFTALFGKYFKDIDITKGESGVQKQFVYTDFEVNAQLKEPKEFFTFMEEVEKSGILIKVKTPVVLASDKDKVYAGFTLRAFKLNSQVKENHTNETNQTATKTANEHTKTAETNHSKQTTEPTKHDVAHH